MSIFYIHKATPEQPQSNPSSKIWVMVHHMFKLFFPRKHTFKKVCVFHINKRLEAIFGRALPAFWPKSTEGLSDIDVSELLSRSPGSPGSR